MTAHRPTGEPLVTASDVAGLLGVSPATVLDWFEADRLPGFKLGRAVRFRPSEIDAWLEARRRGPSPALGSALVSVDAEG